MRVVEVGQYFVTRDAGEFRQFRAVACREYTLPRDDKTSQPKGWIRGNMRIGLVLEVTTSFQHFKYGIETRIQSVNQDDSHSWVRISYGTVKYVNDSIEDNTENPADSKEEESVQTSSSVVAAMSKAKAKPQPRESTGTTTIPEQWQLYVKNLRTIKMDQGNLRFLMGQSIVLGEVEGSGIFITSTTFDVHSIFTQLSTMD